MHKINDKIITFIRWSNIEEEAREQILNISKLPFIFKHVAIMPDCHYGKGATVGTVLPTKGAIIPAAVGVDIGCGMISVKTSLKKEDLKDLSELRQGIERRIPMSAGKNNSKITQSAQQRINKLEEFASEEGLPNAISFYDNLQSNWRESLGTLGGGNHFIEICLDENDTVWATLHSGSRGIGNQIGQYHIKKAQELMDKWFIKLRDKDLAYLPEGTEEFEYYITDLRWAQYFALLNREEMMDRVLTELSYHIHGEDGHQDEIEVERINCHHNFTRLENHMGQNIWVTRKGAVHADKGVMGMIPGSMGTRSYIFEGKGNVPSFKSAPHGAGRRMSRTQARKEFTREDLKEAMKGIEYADKDVLDEIPGAYKDIDEVMEDAKELVEIKYTLKQIINCKGD